MTGGADDGLEPLTPLPEYVVPVLVLFGLLLLAYAAMWWGWRRRAARHGLPELAPAPPGEEPAATLRADARYFGTAVAGNWLERVTARGLGARSTARLSLSTEGLDVVRPAGRFRIPVSALRGARHDRGIAGKVVPPHGLLVVTWQHGEHLLDSGFRLTGTAAADKGVTEAHNTWIRAIGELARDHGEPQDHGQPRDHEEQST